MFWRCVMSDEIRVWIRKRKGKKKTSYHLRWIDHAGKWRNKKIGTDFRLAEREAVLLEHELCRGTHVDLKRIDWPTFVEEVTALMDGTHHDEAKRVLEQFGTVMQVKSPRTVRHATIKGYVEHLRKGDEVSGEKKRRSNSPATIAKKLRYLRLAFNTGIRLECVAKNPLDGWNWQKIKKGTLRILTHDEEARLLASAEKLYGFSMRTFLRFTLETWGRLSEVTGLLWQDVQFEDRAVVFRDTKSVEDRFVPIAESSDLLDDLRRLQLQTLQAGGPFTIYADKSNTAKKRDAILKDAKIPPITVHDLRRTGITRALLANVPLVTVQRLAGHRDIKTTMRYYAQVNTQDLRDGIERVRVAG